MWAAVCVRRLRSDGLLKVHVHVSGTLQHSSSAAYNSNNYYNYYNQYSRSRNKYSRNITIIMNSNNY